MQIPVLFNCLGQEKGSETIPSLLERQVVSPVMMEDTLRELARLGVDTFVEIRPRHSAQRLCPQDARRIGKLLQYRKRGWAGKDSGRAESVRAARFTPHTSAPPTQANAGQRRIYFSMQNGCSSAVTRLIKRVDFRLARHGFGRTRLGDGKRAGAVSIANRVKQLHSV